MVIGVWISLGLYFALMLGTGFYAYRNSTSSSDEYLLGGRKLSSAVAASTAGASDMSGWLLPGLLVYTAIGGFLAVALADFCQGLIMMLALVIMPVVVLSGAGVERGVLRVR